MTKLPTKNVLRRQTHDYCRNCFQNLQEYRQKNCDRCLIALDESRLSTCRIKPLPFSQKVHCIFESMYRAMCAGQEEAVALCYRPARSSAPSSPPSS